MVIGVTTQITVNRKWNKPSNKIEHREKRRVEYNYAIIAFGGVK